MAWLEANLATMQIHAVLYNGKCNLLGYNFFCITVHLKICNFAWQIYDVMANSYHTSRKHSVNELLLKLLNICAAVRS